jgi:hypothetical protein
MIEDEADGTASRSVDCGHVWLVTQTRYAPALRVESQKEGGGGGGGGWAVVSHKASVRHRAKSGRMRRKVRGEVEVGVPLRFVDRSCG